MLDLLNHHNNLIATVFKPYTYAIGAIITGIATPFIFKFILQAPETNCFSHSCAQDSIKINTEQTRSYSNLSFFYIFLTLTITGAIAAHSCPSWSQIALITTANAVIFAEIILELRIKVISNWLPIVAIWLGLLFNADPSNQTQLQPLEYIIAPLIIWSIATIIKKSFANKSTIPNLISPTCLAIPGVLLGLEQATVTIITAAGVFFILSIIETLILLVTKKIAPTIALKPISINIPFNAALLAIIWLKIIL